MVFNYREMLKEAVETGLPSERFYPLDSGSNTPNTVSGMTIDTTARPAPNTLDYLPRRCWAQPMPVLARFRRSQFEHFIEKWSFPKPQVIKGGIVLTADDSFSPVLEKLLGPMNTTNIYGLDDEQIKTSVFEALVEREATNQYRSDNGYYVKGLLNIDDKSRDGMIIHGKLESDSSLHWRINYRTECKGGWLDLVRTVFNLSRLDALMTLAKIVNMNIENLQLLSSNRYSIEWNGSLCIDEDVPNVLHLSRFPAGSGCAELVGKAYIYGNAGQVIGAILRYRLDKKDFCLPATVSNQGELSMGKYKPTAHFLNQHLMDKNPKATILLCQDMRTALAIQKLFDGVRNYDPSGIIVTAHLGTDLSILPWNYLHGHNVVFIPAPTKACMALVKSYRDHITGTQATSFQVYPGFLLHSLPGCDLKKDVEGVTEAEAELLRNSVVLDEVERPLSLARQLVANSVSYQDYQEWGQNLGIFKKPKEMVAQSAANKSPALPPIDPALTPAPAHDLADVNLHHIMRPGSIVMILGKKGTGKTQLAFSCCGSLRKQSSLWSLFPTRSGGVGNVAYVDAETPYDEFQENLKQHGLDNDAGFVSFDKFAPDLPEFCSNFSLRDENFREGLYDYLRKNKCLYVFLDNLTALMGDGVHQSGAAQEVLDWIERLQKAKICVVLVHHKSETDHDIHSSKARGSQLFTTRARAIIELMGKSEIQYKNLGPDDVQKSLLRDGLTVGISFNVCKPAPALERKTFWAYLALGEAEWEFLGATGADGKEIDFHIAKPALEEKRLPAVTDDALLSVEHNLSPDKRNVLEVLRSGSARRAEIQEKTGFGEERTREILKFLITSGKVMRKGKGKSTYYVLKSEQ